MNKKSLGKLAISLTAALALGAGALAGGAAQTVVVMSADLQAVLAYGETRGLTMEYRAQYQAAGTPVKIVVTDEDGETRVFDGTVTADGGVNLTMAGAGKTLQLTLESSGVKLTVVTGQGATITGLPQAALDRIAAARARAAEARTNGSAGAGAAAQEGAGTQAGAAAEAGAQAGGTSAGAEASGSVTITVPVSAPVAPAVPPRR